jgi:hypothetical protein
MSTKDPKVEQAFKKLSDQFPKRYNVKATKYIKALLYSLAEGDGFIDSQVDAVADNSIVVTASGKYLDRLGSLYGVGRGRATGVQDDDFQKIVPIVGNNPKQIITTLQKVIDRMYGPYATHANTTCSAPAPYNLSGGPKLRVRVDDKEIEVTFKPSDAISIEKTTAQEVATAISERSQGRIIGSVVSNVRTGEEFVNLRTKTMGSQGFIQVLGGEAQGVLRFPEIRHTRQGIATYNVERHLGTDEMNYKFVSGISPAGRTAGVRVGDHVIISSDSGFHENNCGTFKVSFVEEDSFRILNPRGVVESDITHQNEDDFVFYKPDMGNILLNSRPATILHTDLRELTVILPVTSPIVKRTLRGSHHFHSGLSNVVTTTDDTITLASPAGFKESGSVFVVGNRASAEGVVSSVSGGSINMINGEDWPETGAMFSPTERKFYFYNGKYNNSLLSVSPTPPASLAGTSLKYVKKFSYTGLEGNLLTGVSPSPTNIVGFDVTSDIYIEEGFPGSFLYDLGSSFSISEKSTFINEKIQQGSSRTVINVANVSDWEDEGYFMINFGTKEEEGPVRYLNKVGQEALIIDPGHVFKRDHLKGVSVRKLSHLGPSIPRVGGQDLPVYLTGTSQARSLMAEYLRSLVAAGIVLKFKIIVPDQKWEVLPLLYSTNPLEDDLAIKHSDDERVAGGNNLPPSLPPSPSPVLVFNPIIVPEPPVGGDDDLPPSQSWATPTLAGVARRVNPITGIVAYHASLTWNEIEEATGYKIWKSGGGIADSVIELPAQTSYLDYSVFIGSTYTYRIQAVKGSENMGYVATPLSSPVSVMIEPGLENDLTTAPDINLTYFQSGNWVNLSWFSPNNWTQSYSTMRIFRGIVNNGVFETAQEIGFSTTTQYNDTNPIVGETLYYYIVHKNGNVLSQPSNSSTIYITPQPLTLTLSVSMNNYEPGIVCNYNPIAGATSYQLFELNESLIEESIAPGTSLTSQYIMALVKNNVSTAIQFNKTYTLIVKAFNANGVLQQSSQVSITTPTRPAAPAFRQLDIHPYEGKRGAWWDAQANGWLMMESNSSTPPTSAPSWPSNQSNVSIFRDVSTLVGAKYFSTLGNNNGYDQIWYLHVWSIKNESPYLPYAQDIPSASPVTLGPYQYINPFSTVYAEKVDANSIKISTMLNGIKGVRVQGASSIKVTFLEANGTTVIKTQTFGHTINQQVITGFSGYSQVNYKWEFTNWFTTISIPNSYAVNMG